MAPRLSGILMESGAEVEDALERRLKKLTVEHSEDEKPLLELQKEEARKERVYIRNSSLLEKIYALIEGAKSEKEFQEKAENILRLEYNKSISSREFLGLLLRYSLRKG